MIGWELQCKMSDGTTQWLPLQDGKESNPIEAVEHTIATRLAKEPASAWWVLWTLHKQDHIIKTV